MMIEYVLISPQLKYYIHKKEQRNICVYKKLKIVRQYFTIKMNKVASYMSFEAHNF